MSELVTDYLERRLPLTSLELSVGIMHYLALELNRHSREARQAGRTLNTTPSDHDQPSNCRTF